MKTAIIFILAYLLVAVVRGMFRYSENYRFKRNDASVFSKYSQFFTRMLFDPKIFLIALVVGIFAYFLLVF